MIPRIKSVKPLNGYLLHVIFDDGKDCIYDVNDDINTSKSYEDLKKINGLFEQVQLDESRTCVFGRMILTFQVMRFMRMHYWLVSRNRGNRSSVGRKFCVFRMPL